MYKIAAEIQGVGRSSSGISYQVSKPAKGQIEYPFDKSTYWKLLEWDIWIKKKVFSGKEHLRSG